MDRKIVATREEINRCIRNEEPALPVPVSAGLLLFRRNDRLLYHIRSNNLSMLFDSLFKENSSAAESLGEVWDRYDALEFEPYENDFQALVAEKMLLNNEQPEYYRRLRLSDNYVYLAINCLKPPYLTIQQDTTKDDWYLGPFRDRFNLIELIETMGKEKQTPICKPFFVEATPNVGIVAEIAHPSDGECPHKMAHSDSSEQCPAYCDDDNKDRLISVLKDNYLQNNNKLIENLRNLYQKQHDDLQFYIAEETRKKMTIISGYYRMLRFLTAIKSLDYEFIEREVQYTISKGRLAKIKRGNQTELFDMGEEEIFNEYRDNELLALPKERLVEMWTVYEKVSKIYPELIDKIFEDRKTDVINSFVRYWKR